MDPKQSPGNPLLDPAAFERLLEKVRSELDEEMNRLEVEGAEEMSPRAAEALAMLTFLTKLRTATDPKALLMRLAQVMSEAERRDRPS